jgi:hypothetical protein
MNSIYYNHTMLLVKSVKILSFPFIIKEKQIAEKKVDIIFMKLIIFI